MLENVTHFDSNRLLHPPYGLFGRGIYVRIRLGKVPMTPFSNSSVQQRVGAIDTHTGGEPTRVVISGIPDLGSGSLIDQRTLFATQYDEFRSAVVNEPRGSDVMVGALLLPPQSVESVASVIFFNNVGTLNMCGHGTIGVAIALQHLGRIELGKHQLDTPVGSVQFELFADNRVTIQNIPSYRYRSGVEVAVDGIGPITGEIAWGGNWFFLVNQHGQTLNLDNVERLTVFSWRIRQALAANEITGENGAEIDHVELCGPPVDPENQSRNFVLCPGKAYDRSPCGTGTSAKLACLYAAGKIKPGETFKQESILGSVFEGSVELMEDQLIPSITGTAYVNAETTLIIDLKDPFRFGIRN